MAGKTLDTRPRAVLSGGPLSRRVYLLADLQQLAEVEAASARGWEYFPTDRKVTLGQIFHVVDRNVKALEHHLMLVWEHRPGPVRPVVAEPNRCCYLRCPDRPQFRFEPAARGARPKLVCAGHLGGLVAADKYGNQSDASPTVVDLDAGTEM